MHVAAALYEVCDAESSTGRLRACNRDALFASQSGGAHANPPTQILANSCSFSKCIGKISRNAAEQTNVQKQVA